MDEVRPAPLVPAEADVRALDGFMLNTERLLASELWALATGDEFKAAMALWCRAWKQVPAGSLPDDDRTLAGFSGAGRAWPKVREMALRGFVRCSDGRLYHRTLCQDVVRALGKMHARQAESEGDAERKRREREDRSRLFAELRAAGMSAPWNTTTSELRLLVTHHVTSHVTPPVTRDRPAAVTASQGQGHRQGSSTTTPTPLPADPEVVEEGPVLKFIRSHGGYMHRQGEDRRQGWLSDVDGMTLEQIAEVFQWGKARGQVIVYPGKGPGYFGGVRTAMQESSRKAAAAERVRMEADALAERERLELSGLNERASKAEAATRARCGGFLAAYDEDPARWLSAMTGEQCDQIKAIRTAYNARRPLGLLVRHLEGMPRDLVEAGMARGREMHEQTEGATA